jgi:ATP citrate (pro-S)-lyase
MLNIQQLRQLDPNIVAVGSYPTIIQAILDFDYLSGRKEPSIHAILVTTSNRNFERYFWGSKEIIIPRYTSTGDIPQSVKEKVNIFVNFNSGRRAMSSTLSVLDAFPNIKVGSILAENMPELHALSIYDRIKDKDIIIAGPAGVGMVIPQVFKVGPIGGLEPVHQLQSHLFTQGNTAVFSASAGMIGEIITVLAQANVHLSFALQFGGDRFPICTPKEAFQLAEEDPQTEYIVYYGELGGTDEYDVAQLIKDNKVTKKVVAYISGSISEMFETPPQFGHAKAMAKKGEETAQAKRKTLSDVGVEVASTFEEFVHLLQKLPATPFQDEQLKVKVKTMEDRKKKLFMSSISADKDGVATVLGEDILTLATHSSFASIVASMLLGKKIKSQELENCVDFILKLLVDHGPYQSGVVNTMVTARAGRDLVSSLASGLLTVGSRFGGATNEAARNWLRGVNENMNAHDFVESFVKDGKIIEGIGHLKYRADALDPRVTELMKYTEGLKEKKHITFAREVEKVTTAKKGNLILNVDGAMAAVLLDILAEKEGKSPKELEDLVNAEFFNALFVLSRSVGFVAHYLDQKRLDEGLFRLTPDDVANVE